MQELAHDEHVRHLQRLAYGAVASDAERAAAVAELEALRRDQGAPAAPADAPSPTATDARASTAPEAAAAPRPVSHAANAADGEASARRFRWAIAAGTAALFLGVAVGWQLSARSATPSAPVAAAESDLAREINRLAVPVADTSVLGLFDRTPTPADVPNGGSSDYQIAPEAYRLLLTRSDGVAVHAARVDGGKNVCVTLAMPDAAPASSCTREGMFPQQGLSVEFYVQGSLGLVRGTLHADGSAAITPTGNVVKAMPIVSG